MSKPEDHLIRTAATVDGRIALSKLTGLSRLNLEMHRLAASDHLGSPAGNERFLYVLEGSAVLITRIEGQPDSEPVVINSGDFAALNQDETAELSTDQGVAVLLGASGR
jgi:hypothetical protein